MIELVDVRLDHPRGGAPLVRGREPRGRARARSSSSSAPPASARRGSSRRRSARSRRERGRIEVLGRDVAKLRRASLRLLRRRIGIVPQDLCLLDDRSAQLNVVLPLEIDGIPRSMSIVRAAEILGQLGLESEASLPVDCLSMSARQRVAVARALVREPELVIADHPTSLQDAAGAELVCAALADGRGGRGRRRASCSVATPRCARSPSARLAHVRARRRRAVARSARSRSTAQRSTSCWSIAARRRSAPTASDRVACRTSLPFPTAGVA